MHHRGLLTEKMIESLISVLPIVLIVSVLCTFFIPINSGIMLSFLLGSVMIVVGMGLFTIGAETSMTQIGTHIGSKMTQSRNLGLIVFLSFILGIAITVAEPDLQVLATNAPNINTNVLIIAVSIGVGFFLVISMLRILFGISFRWLLIVFYTVLFVLALFSEQEFLSVAFDSGGVTTGPMTVPFIISLGIGVASIRSDERAKEDSFGLVALCSIGPILAVLLLEFIYTGEAETDTVLALYNFENTLDMGMEYIYALPKYFIEVAVALLPIIIFFILFQIISLKLHKRLLIKILIGMIFTYIGLAFFLTGVNVGFSSLGYILGGEIAEKFKWMLIPLAMIMGWFIIKAEPAVQTLTKQVTEVSAGAISEKTMRHSLSIAISCAMGLAMVRVLTGISILWFMIPGYIISLILAFFVPPTYTAIAFDAGGVASGPMTATFMLPFAMGACTSLGGNVITDAFGLVALVAMTPLITIQIMGFLSKIKSKSNVQTDFISRYKDDEIIELWEVS